MRDQSCKDMDIARGPKISDSDILKTEQENLKKLDENEKNMIQITLTK